MSEDPTPVDETVEEAPAVEQEQPVDTDDVGALKRAYDRVKEERQQAKEELRRIREDKDYDRASLLEKWGYEVSEEEPPEEEDVEFEEDDDPVKPLTEKLTKLEQWRTDQEAKETAAQIRKDLSEINEGSDWELDDDDRKWIVTQAAEEEEFNRASLERAHTKFIARQERVAERGVERAKKPKKPPHVTAPGKPGTQVPDLDNQAERHEWYKNRLAQPPAT